MQVKNDATLIEILAEMREAITVPRHDREAAHLKADDLLVKAARVCGVPRSIIDAYEKVEKFYA